MNKNSLLSRPSALALFLLFGFLVCTNLRAEGTFELQYPESVRNEPYSGRVYLFFSKSNREPRFGPNWFRPEPFASLEVLDWKPGTPLVISPKNEKLRSFPKPLSELSLEGSQVQAVVRFNKLERNVGSGPGNVHSKTLVVPQNFREGGSLSLELTETIPEVPFQETEFAKLLSVPSPSLSKFTSEKRFTRATVLLPVSYPKQPDRRYPVIFSIPGFGGNHRVSTRPVQENNEKGVEFIRVFLDPDCPLGHHVFADSANNGPVGKALVEEFIPELDHQFRTVPEPTARFLTGHSSGGWSSLWLQVTYPETFGGTWSTAPDPVDFRDFQLIDLYASEENMYHDRQGNRRPLARRGTEPVVWYQDFDRMEEVLGPGGQLHSFEAVFSPRGEDELPLRLWDRDTGKIDTAVAKNWEAYDIRLVLERNWPVLGPKLKGKLNIHMGDLDTFYLDGATRNLKKTLEDLGSDAIVEMHPDKDHSTLYSPALLDRIRKEMTSQFLKHHEP